MGIYKSDLLEALCVHRFIKRESKLHNSKSFITKLKKAPCQFHSLTWPHTIQRHVLLKYILEEYPYRNVMEFNFDSAFKDSIQLPLSEPISLPAPILGKPSFVRKKRKGHQFYSLIDNEKKKVSSYPIFLDPIWGLDPKEEPLEENPSKSLKKHEIISLYRPDPVQGSAFVFHDLIYATVEERFKTKTKNQTKAAILQSCQSQTKNFAFISDKVTQQLCVLFKALEHIIRNLPPEKILNWSDVMVAVNDSKLTVDPNFSNTIENIAGTLNLFLYDPMAPTPFDDHEKKYISNLRGLNLIP